MQQPVRRIPASTKRAAIGPVIAVTLQRSRILVIAPYKLLVSRLLGSVASARTAQRAACSLHDIKPADTIKRAFGARVMFSPQRGQATQSTRRGRDFICLPTAARGSCF